MTNFPINQKKLFLAHFPHFGGTVFFFFKNPALSRTTPHAKFQRKLMSQSQENFGTEGRKDGQTLIHMTLSFQPQPGVQKETKI